MADQAHYTLNRAWDANGDPISGAKAYFYESGTSTLLTVYSDEALTTAHPSPLVADSEGVFDPVYTSGSVAVKVNMTDASDVQLANYPVDPVMLDGTAASGASELTFSPVTNNPSTTVQDAIEYNADNIETLEANVGNSQKIQVTTGTGDAFTLASYKAITAYALGQAFLIRFDRAPTGAATLNVNSLGAKNIKKYNNAGTLVDIGANDWIAGEILTLVYDSTQFIVVGDTPTIGLGQTWQDVSGSRAAGTSYQNTTGAPIEVRGQFAGGASRTFQVSDDDATWVSLQDSDATILVPFGAVIPNGYYYRVSGGAMTWTYWAELRD